MLGTISTRQKCPVCNGRLVHDERRKGLFCKKHPQISANKFIVRFPKGIYLNFRDYNQAAQTLNGLRYKKSENSLDIADFKKDKPNAFNNLAEKYLNTKKTMKSFRDIKRHINHACKYFKDMNVKDINGAHIEDYLFGVAGISEKTRHNKKSQLHDFWSWLLRRGVINPSQMPLFPEIKYDLGFRKILDWETQQAVMDEVYRIALNPKVGFGIELLATYVALRPGDLLKIKEGDINLKDNEIIIHDPTKSKMKFKPILLTEDHTERFRELKEMYPGFPALPFFRHIPGISGCRADRPFGKKYLYKYWIQACENIGIEGVDLYGGTRHSTTTEIARRRGENAAIRATGHSTNKAFLRYCQVQDRTALEMAELTVRERNKPVRNIVQLKGYQSLKQS